MGALEGEGDCRFSDVFSVSFLGGDRFLGALFFVSTGPSEGFCAEKRLLRRNVLLWKLMTDFESGLVSCSSVVVGFESMSSAFLADGLSFFDLWSGGLLVTPFPIQEVSERLAVRRRAGDDGMVICVCGSNCHRAP